MEGEIGRFRRRHPTPVADAASLPELNEMLAADAADDHRRVAARTETVGQTAAREVPLLNPLPDNAFEASTTLMCRADTKARICVRPSYTRCRRGWPGAGCKSRWARTGSRSATPASWSPGTRSLHKGSEDLVVDHYLEVLTRRPGALPGATALATARAMTRSPPRTNGSGTPPAAPVTARAPRR